MDIGWVHLTKSGMSTSQNYGYVEHKTQHCSGRYAIKVKHEPRREGVPLFSLDSKPFYPKFGAIWALQCGGFTPIKDNRLQLICLSPAAVSLYRDTFPA